MDLSKAFVSVDRKLLTQNVNTMISERLQSGGFHHISATESDMLVQKVILSNQQNHSKSSPRTCFRLILLPYIHK